MTILISGSTTLMLTVYPVGLNDKQNKLHDIFSYISFITTIYFSIVFNYRLEIKIIMFVSFGLFFSNSILMK